jgi:HAD superfamily hydrolase (TIGR01490 family)
LTGLAFYDLDGTLVSSNVVTQYAFYARHQPDRVRAARKTAKLLLLIPGLFVLDLYSRSLFNTFFYREYRGYAREWLESSAGLLFDRVLKLAIYPGAPALVAADRESGYRTVLLTGSLDFAIAPLAHHLGFDELIANRLVFREGIATGELAPPLLAGEVKAAAIRETCARYNIETACCKAYSDSVSDLPMLEAVGHPAAANPGRRLRRVALARGWPILDLKETRHVHAR